MKKTCAKCRLEKELKEFSKDICAKSEYGAYCKLCKSLRTMTWKKKNPLKVKKYARRWNKTNKDKLEKLHEKWQASHPGYKREYNKKKYGKNRKQMRASAKEWYIENPERNRELRKKWTKAHPGCYKKWGASHRKIKRKSNKLWVSQNKEKKREIDNRYIRKNPDRVKTSAYKSYLKRMYDITLQEYNDLLSKQGNLCAICKRPPSQKRRLSVDHCHKTGKIRGLLHSNCNLAIGLLQEKPSFIKGALEYLNEN